MLCSPSRASQPFVPSSVATPPLYYYTQSAYNSNMRASFVELPAFERLRNEYLDDESFRAMQNALMDDPSAGDVI